MKNNYGLIEGDIFEIKIDNRKAYFQFIYKDPEYLSSDMIRVYDFFPDINDRVDFNELIKSPVLSYTYTRINQGIREGFWSKVHNISIEPNFKHPVFRQLDLALGPDTKTWFTWETAFMKRTYIKDSIDNYRHIPISRALAPIILVNYLKEGKNLFYLW